MDHRDDPGITLASIVRRCYRIASLRGDVANMSWLELEGRDLSLKIEGGNQQSFVFTLLESLPVEDSAVAHAKFEIFLGRRQSPGSTNVYGGSVEQAENALAALTLGIGDPMGR